MNNSKRNQHILFGILLILSSVLFYAIHYAIFRDAHHIFTFFVGDVAFVFIEVLLVTLIIHQLLKSRDRRARLQKLNMVIGAFFTKMGLDLLKCYSSFDANSGNIAKHLLVEQEWSPAHFLEIKNVIQDHDYQIDITAGDIGELKNMLLEHRDFVLRLLANQSLLEHESFTELLWAISHMSEELSHRENLESLTKTDAAHLAGDAKRAYSILIREWLSYMEHLKNEYPYLFSLALRTNPFDPKACVEIG